MGLDIAEPTEAPRSLPPDWRSARIEEIASIGSGGTPSRKNPAYWGGTIPWVTTAQIDFGTITEASERITEAGLRGSAARMLAPGTLLLALYGQGKTRGKVAKLGIAAATNQACASIVPGGQVDGDYLFHFLASQYQALRSASNAGSQENLTGRIVKDTLVVLPPKAEQAAIATALSDVDALLAKLDQVIAKKRDLKQAALQQLLTGRTRLPSFSKNWEPTRLRDLAHLTMGKTPSRRVQAFWGAGHKWASIADMQSKVLNETGEQITEAGAAGVAIVPKGTLLMSFKLSIGRLAFAGCDLYTNEAICAFRKLKANAAFLYYALQRVDFSQYGKQAVKGYTLNKQSLNAVEVFLPEAREQEAIAEVLSDMDAELAAVEARREKTRQLKQGMMQALLTGKVRLT